MIALFFWPLSPDRPGLWCVLELFTFVHMGGKTYDINCVSLALAPDDWQAIQLQCATADGS